MIDRRQYHHANRFERMLWVPANALATGIGTDYDPIGDNTSVTMSEDETSLSIIHPIGESDTIWLNIFRQLDGRRTVLETEWLESIAPSTVAVRGRLVFTRIQEPNIDALIVSRGMRIWPMFAALAGAQPAPTPEQMAVVAGSNLEF